MTFKFMFCFTFSGSLLLCHYQQRLLITKVRGDDGAGVTLLLLLGVGECPGPGPGDVRVQVLQRVVEVAVMVTRLRLGGHAETCLL